MKILFTLIALVLCSCSQSDNRRTIDEGATTTISDSSRQHGSEDFQTFLNTFPLLELPLQLSGCEPKHADLPEINEENPSSFFQDYYGYVVGRIEFNGSYVAVVTLARAECYLPVLTTYTLEGEIIDSKTIACGSCSHGRECYVCVETAILYDDFTIYTADTHTYSDCDENYNSIPGTEEIEVIYREGRLTETGIIELSDEKKKAGE